MSPFGRRKAPAPTDEERRAAEVDLERIRQGGIPLGAEERLKRVATASTPFFTSDLSAKEYALAQARGSAAGGAGDGIFRGPTGLGRDAARLLRDR